MTEKDRHGTGASGWCIARKRCHECTYAACSCPCHQPPTDPQDEEN